MTTLRLLHLFAFALVLAQPSTGAQQIVVIATNTILADLVREVAGSQIRVVCLAKSGADLHDFEPRPGDMRQMGSADLFVINGLGLEPWISKFIGNSGFRGTTVTASDGIVPIQHTAGCDSAEHSGHQHPVDPHAWHEPASVRIFVRNIRAALEEVDPSNRESYIRNEADFNARLNSIESAAQARAAAIPLNRRRMITSHDSLAYLGRAFAIEMIPVSGIATGAEPNARRVAELIDLIRETGVSAIFVESGGNPALIRRIAADTGIEVAGRLLTDSLDEPGRGADTYLGMMEQNLRHILDSLK